MAWLQTFFLLLDHCLTYVSYREQHPSICRLVKFDCFLNQFFWFFFKCLFLNLVALFLFIYFLGELLNSIEKHLHPPYAYCAYTEVSAEQRQHDRDHAG